MTMKLILSTVAAVGLLAQQASAQDYPTQTVSIIVPAGAGGGGDTTSRLLAEAMSKDFPAGVIVENKPGATGMVGARYVKEAKPDGYTLLSLNQSISSLAPQLDPSVPVHAVEDFDPVCITSTYPTGLQITGNAPYDSVAEMISAAKEDGKTFTYAHVSSFMDLTARLFGEQAGIPVKGVPYKSMPEAVTDIASGRVDFLIGDLNSGKAFLENGTLKAVMITSPERNPVWPNIPSAPEAGVEDFQLFAWTAVVAPKGTDPEALEKLYDVVGRALQTDTIRDRFSAMGFTASTLCGAEAKSFIEKDYTDWKAHIARLN